MTDVWHISFFTSCERVNNKLAVGVWWLSASYISKKTHSGTEHPADEQHYALISFIPPASKPEKYDLNYLRRCNHTPDTSPLLWYSIERDFCFHLQTMASWMPHWSSISAVSRIDCGIYSCAIHSIQPRHFKGVFKHFCLWRMILDTFAWHGGIINQSYYKTGSICSSFNCIFGTLSFA